MAGAISEVRAKFTASAQGLMNSIRDMRNDLQHFGTNTQEAMNEASQGAENFQDSLNQVDANNMAQEVNSAANQVEAALDGISAEGLEQEFNQAGQAAGEMGDTVATHLTDAERYARVAEGGMKSFRKTFLSWTAAAAGVATIVTSMGGLVAINETYTQALNQVTAATGASEEESKALGQSLQNIYANNYGADFQDIAAAMADVERNTKLTGEALEIVTESALALRDTFGYEVAESSKVASTMMKQFGISADEAYELMAQGAQEGLDKSGDMMDSFNEYSVYFAQLGFDAEGMWNVFKAGADSGAFNADKVGDAIKELGIRVKDGSKTTADGFAAIGLNADQMAADFAKGGDSAQQALQKTFKGLADIEDPVKRNAAGVALFGTQFEDLEYETVKAMGTVRNEANMTGQAMDTIRQVKYNSVTEAIQGMGRQLVVSLINPIQEKVMPVVNEMVNAFRNNMPQIQAIMMSVFSTITNVVSALAPTFMNVFGILKNVAPAILIPLGLAFQGLMAAIAPLANYVTDLVQRFTGMAGFAPIMAGLVTAFVTYQVTLKAVMAIQRAWAVLSKGHIILMNAWRAAILLFNSAWLANPIGLVIAAIAGLVAAFVVAYKQSETFRNIVDKLWAALKDGFNTAVNWITTTLPQWWANIVSFFSNAWTWLKGFFSKWGIEILAVIAPFIGIPLLIAKHWDTIKTFFSNLWNNIVTTVQAFIASMVAKFTAMASAVGGVIMGFVNIAKGYFDNFVNNVKYLIEPFLNWFKQSWQNLKDIVLGIVGVFISLVTGDFESLKNSLQLIWQTIKKQIENTVNAIKETAIRLFNLMKSALVNSMNALKSGALAVWNALKSAVTSAATATKDGAVNAWNAMKTGVINAVNALKSGAVNAWNSLKSSVTSTVNGIKSGVTNGFNSAKSSAVNAFNGLRDGVANAISSVKSKVTDMKNDIIGKVKSINLRTIGKDIVRGLVNGLGDMLGSLKRKAKEIADTVKNAIADKLKIKSPSRVMMGMGVNVGEGLQIGMTDMIRKVGKTAANMAGTVTDNMNLSGALGGALNASASVKNLMTLKHVIDLQNVPQGMSEANLIKVLQGALGDPRIQRQIDRVNAVNNLKYNKPLGAG